MDDFTKIGAGIGVVRIEADGAFAQKLGVVRDGSKVQRPVDANGSGAYAIDVVGGKSHRFTEGIAIGIVGSEANVESKGITRQRRVDMEVAKESLAFRMIAVAPHRRGGEKKVGCEDQREQENGAPKEPSAFSCHNMLEHI